MPMMAYGSSLRVAAIQMTSTRVVRDNLEQCCRWVTEAAKARANLIILPENFAYFGDAVGRREVAESLERGEGPIVSTLRGLAEHLGIAILAGGWPEASDEPRRPYNSATLVGPTGAILANYRKLHLFDVTLPSGVVLKESEAVMPGNEVVVCDVFGFRLGLSICYDLRFPELYRALVNQGAEVLLVPSAFTRETGQAHFELLLRARAVESQAFVIAANQVGEHSPNRSTFGHSMVVDPWGTVLASAADMPTIVFATLKRESLEDVRAKLPSLRHQRLSLPPGVSREGT